MIYFLLFKSIVTMSKVDANYSLVESVFLDLFLVC
jgi:hypothetical protein